jgi:hypothetical protein
MGGLNGALTAPGYGSFHRFREWPKIRRAADKIRIRLWLRYPVFLLFMEGLSRILSRRSGVSPPSCPAPI